MRKIIFLLTIVFTISIVLVNVLSDTITIGGTCDLKGGFGNITMRSCKCTGYKMVVRNELPIDGDYQTICVGIGYRSSDDRPILNDLRFVGKVVDVDNSCYYDGACKMKVSNYWVITNIVGDPPLEMERQGSPHGNVYNINGEIMNSFDKVYVKDRQVEVFARKVDDKTLTLYGNKDYFIKFQN